MKKKRRTLKNTLSDLDEIKRKQVLTEVRWIKIQSAIAILAIAGSAIAFCITQQNTIFSAFHSKPQVSYKSSENFVLQNAAIEISDYNGKKRIISPLKSMPAKIELDEGSYKTDINLNNEKIWSDSFFLKTGENRSVILPNFFDKKIEILIKNRNPIVHISDKIDIEISVSGNGFLWIYEMIGDSSKLLFPIDVDTLKNINQVFAEKPFNFPDDIYLAAGHEAKKEKYWFIVTSVNNENNAAVILNYLLSNNITKGEITSIRKNWGAQLLEVTVTL